MFTATVRVPILNLTPTVPATLLPSQNATLSFNVQNTGGCTAVLSDLKVTNPDATVSAAPPFPLAGGQSTTIQTNWRVTGISTRLQGDTDAVYQARLVAANNSNLNFAIGLDWSDPSSSTYGPVTFSATSKEILPIVTVALSAPATATSGTSIAYTVTATNIGAAPSPQVLLTVTLPDGSIQTPTVGSLGPNGSFQTTINYAIPSTQPAGNITATASVIWNDAIANAYGPLNAAATTAVTNPQQFNSLVLTPAAAGQNVVGSPQTFTATLKDSNGVAISGATVQFTVTGANPRISSGATNASGIVALTYTGAAAGLDTVQATSGTAVSNNGVVNWIVPVSAISTSPLLGRFFASPDGNGVFNIPSTATPLWTQAFPTIDFNPPPGTIPGNTSGVDYQNPPFADVITDLNGQFTGTIVAQGNGYIAGVSLPAGVTIPGSNSPLRSFEAVFTGSLTVRSAGQMVFNFFSDDGFVLGIGGGATRVSGSLNNPPSSGFTAFENFAVMGANNTPHGPGGDQIVVNFPAAGTYPYEVDYTENFFGQLSLTMTTASTGGHGVPPTGSVTLTPNTVASKPAGQTQSMTATVADGSGVPLANLGVALVINGANQQALSATTNTQGQATFTYTGTNAGQDSAQAVTNIAGMGTFSGLVNITWTVPTGGGGGGGVSQFITPGWIGSPLPYTLVQGRQAIQLGSGLTLTSGTVDFWPSSNPSLVTVLNANASGGSGATLATFDATTVADGEYVVRLRGTLSNGTTQTSLIPLKVTGENKPGRFTATVTDLTVPLAGIPITIGRTYDSLDRGNVEDFGNGWKLSVGGTQLAVSGSHDVSFTISGRRMTFFFQPQSSGFPFPFLLTPQYVPEPGVFGTLTSDGCSIVVTAGSTTECFPDLFDPYQPTTYTYTNPGGQKYVIGADGTLKSFSDLNGNTLTYTSNGITSSTGLNVSFTRDTQGRITLITDPQQKQYVYSYDANGNLQSVQFPTTPVSSASYTYDPTHLLTSETDPNGNPPATSTYDPAGRLQSITVHPDLNTSFTTSYAYSFTTDGSGNPVSVTTTTNPDGGIETVQTNLAGDVVQRVDALNRKTTYTYFPGTRNLKTETDPIGKITQYTYDANGFRTSRTDPLGNTWSATYNQFGGPLTVSDPTTSQAPNLTTVTYDANFNISSITDRRGQVATFSNYNSQGLPQTMQDARMNDSHYTYDQFGNRASYTDQINRTTQTIYDNMGRLQTETNPRTFPIQYVYDSLGRRTSMTDVLQESTLYEYDFNGNKTKETDANHNATQYRYDGLNRLSQIIYPGNNGTRQFTYDFRGNKLTETDQLGRVTKYVYDLAGQLKSMTVAFGTADAATTSYTYDGDGRKLTETDPRGQSTGAHTTNTYDAAGRLTDVLDPVGRKTHYSYDGKGLRTSMVDNKNRTTSYTYDERGRQLTVTTPGLKSVVKTFDGMGLVLSVTDEELRPTSFGYDFASQLTSVTQVLNGVNLVTQYGYDGAGNKTSQTDTNTHVTTYAYDQVNRRTSRTLPLGQPQGLTYAESSTYDAVGNMLTRQDFNGKTTNYAYDVLNRLLSRTPDPSFIGAPAETFTYTLTGKRATMTDASGGTTYNYTNRDQVLSKSTTLQGALSYTYDLSGNVASVVSSNANGTNVSNTWDAASQLATVMDHWTNGQTSYAFDQTGQLSNVSYPNGVKHNYTTYDNRDRLTNLTVTGPGGAIASYVQAFSLSGRKTSATEATGRAASYGYDTIYRLLNETVSGDPTSANNGSLGYALDNGGNRSSLASSLAALTNQSFTYDANDRISGDTFDTNGNTLTSSGHTFTYDFADRLKQYDNTVAMIYDGDGNRVARTEGGVTHRFLIDDQTPTGYPQIAEELVPTDGVIRQHTYGVMRISQRQLLVSPNWQVSYYGYDGGGSVRQLTDTTGAVTDTYAYDAFGNTVAQTGTTFNQFRYRGEQFDSTLGMYNLRARYYRPLMGRFLTADKYEGKTAPLCT
jgi:RHS repeat-associated protein/uncharacterized repeat protein (TIGR01451 family)